LKTPSDGVEREAPLDALLAGYAAGSLTPELHSLVEAHLAIRPENRGFVRRLEQFKAASLADVEPAPLSDRTRCLAEIFESPPPPFRATPACGDDMVLPVPLLQLFGRPLGEIKWRSLLPGIKEHKLSGQHDCEASLMWVRAGRMMPSHSHDGSEITLVLKGGFSDETGHYRRGDIAFADSDVDHHPLADSDEDCVCFAVTDAPLRLTGPIGRIVQRLLRH
jgi:putative transcriptional regulator